MAKPRIAERVPAILDLEAGTYYWCSCGRSAKQPFCDGSHRGSDFAPLKLEIEEPRRMALCQCKHSESAPICDGRHRDLV